MSLDAKVPTCPFRYATVAYRKYLTRPQIMGHPDATDLTATLRAAQSGGENV
jgi:hypothetical protein